MINNVMHFLQESSAVIYLAKYEPKSILILKNQCTHKKVQFCFR